MAVMFKLALLFSVLFVIDYCNAESLVLGTTGQVAFIENVKLGSIPLKVRTKNVFYSGNQLIKGISVVDRAKTKAKVSITSGGIGFTFTNIKLKSERGDELDYQIQIYI